MLQALLRNKFSRSEEELEDLLTSNVFGALQYSARHDLLAEFLAGAITASGVEPLRGLPPISAASFDFWPWLTRTEVGCEPDVCVRLVHDDLTRTVVLVESKVRAGKHRAPDWMPKPRDQLARQAWCLLDDEAHRRCVLFVTTHLDTPRGELRESEKELREVHVADGYVPIAWVPWHRLVRILTKGGSGIPLILADLLRVLRRLHLTDFEGISPPRDLPAAYRFSAEAEAGEGWFLESPSALPSSFRFVESKGFDLLKSLPSTNPRWRFQA